MARDYIQELTDAVMFAESRGRRFDKSGKKLLEGPKTKYGTAKGEMQVLDDVMRRPGYGVKPAKKDTPEERARVGRDLLKAFSNKYKTTEAALAAYNWGPGNVNKWLARGGDFNELPKETRNYIAKVRGRMPEGLFSEAPRTPMMADSAPTRATDRAPLKPSRKRVPQEADTRATFTKGAGAPPSQAEMQARLDIEKMEPGSERVTQEVLNNLGPNYQAALAAMTLADTRDDDEEESLSREYFEEEQNKKAEDEAMAARPSLFSGLDIQYQSPFPEEQAPMQLAKGGFVGQQQGSTAAEMLKALKYIGKEGVSNAESIARRAVATVPGVVGDIEGLFRDDKARKFATSKEVERDYLPSRLTTPTREAAGFGEIGEMIGLPVDPTKVVRGAKQAGKALAPKAAEMLLQLAPGAEPMYAVKPKGGVFFPAGAGSGMDTYLTDIRKAVAKNVPDISGKDAERVLGMIEEKARQYLTKSYGTGSDPIREALLQGRLTLTGTDAEKLRKYAIRAAREGDPEALSDMEKLYDAATRITGKSLDPKEGMSAPDRLNRVTGVKLGEKEKMSKEGVVQDLMNPSVAGQTREDLSRTYGSGAEKMLAEFLSGAREPGTGAEKAVKMAAEKGEPIYDMASRPGLEIMSPDNIAKGIATIPLKDIERMSFPEMVIRGAKNTLLDRSQDELVAKVRTGKTVPLKFFKEGVSPLKVVEDANWVSIDTPLAVRLEGAAMHHSVGDYATSDFYGDGGKKAFLAGKAKVFSLRGKDGMPQLTVSARNDPEGLFITQVKAPYNSLPTEAEKKELFKFFDAIKPIGFKSKIAPEKYYSTRTGASLDEADRPLVNWAEEYSRYTKE